ncbi:uncharacterized protein LOC119093959 isoform X2 [Pollicipes pollicipes]|uniref:uncharacterized protein LOC119093959 isoform X2 n=1 Tax=Pollicipes pollicipes TaxID=41117 RepID=UPI00188525CF|nr:uncharacterized protein LOC119093959 isoform X2 [Pollicipes pollicipes]
MGWLPAVLFTAELYHCVVHVLVLIGWRLLPRKDLVRTRVYFLVDAFTVALISYWVVPHLWWLGAIQNVQHFSYFFCWEKTWFAKRVVSWSSLDWDRSRWQPDLLLGTLFDVSVHAVNACYLGIQLSGQGVLAACLISALLVYVVLYNPRLAWNSKDSMPECRQ